MILLEQKQQVAQFEKIVAVVIVVATVVGLY